MNLKEKAMEYFEELEKSSKEREFDFLYERLNLLEKLVLDLVEEMFVSTLGSNNSEE